MFLVSAYPHPQKAVPDAPTGLVGPKNKEPLVIICLLLLHADPLQ